jgi:hypothetical protein
LPCSGDRGFLFLGRRWLLMQSRFDANRDIVIDGEPDEAGHYRMWTQGLSARGQPELEMVKVPEAHARDAGAILNAVANYLVNDLPKGRSLKDGESLAVSAGQILVPLRARSSTLPEGSRGFRLLDFSGESLEMMASQAIATVKVAKAWLSMTAESGSDHESALALIDDAIALWPGDPEFRERRGPAGATLNYENYLAYLTKAALMEDDAEADNAYREALQRSALYELEELGVKPERLKGLGEAELEAAWKAAEASGATTEMPAMGLPGGPSFVISPIVYSTEQGELAAHVAIVPWNLKRYAATKLTDEYRALAWELVRHASTHPGDVLAAARETHWFYESKPVPLGAESNMQKVLGSSVPIAARIMSIVRADLQRRQVAGLKPEQVRAVYGLELKAEALRAARDLMEKLRAAEAREFAAAVSGGAASVRSTPKQ